MNLDEVQQAEAFFFHRRPETVPTARAFLLGALERWPSTQAVTQKSQVGLRDPRPYCALWPPLHGRLKHRKPQDLVLSLFLNCPLPSRRVTLAVEPYPGRWTNHLLLSSPEDLDEVLWDWVAQAHQFRCGT